MKKLLATTLCIVMIFSTIMSASALRDNLADPKMIVEEGFTVGDADGDGNINANDAISIKKYCANIFYDYSHGADINGDGEINAKDLLIFKKCIVSLDSFENYKNEETLGIFQIGGNNISDFSIVYHPDSKYVENNYYAADTLRKFINIATGVNLGITVEADKPHKIEFVDVTTIPGLEEELEMENYKYEVVDGDLYIYGTRRGAMYAVYEILEEYLGYRFYNDTFTSQYTQRLVNIEEGTSVFRVPYLEFRFCNQGFWRNDEAHYFPSRLNGVQHGDSSEALGTLTGPQFTNDHLLAYYWRMATGHVDVNYASEGGSSYAAKYEAGKIVDVEEGWMNHWSPCFTSDGHYATLFRGMLETMRYIQDWNTFREDTSLMSFSFCDNTAVCTCAECKFIYNSGTQGRNPDRIYNLNCGEAGLILYIANRVCDDIKAMYEGRPASIDELGTGEDDYWGYGEAIRDAYPNIRVQTTIYDLSFPNEKLFSGEGYAEKFGYGYDAIIPRDNLCIVFKGYHCSNHYMGSNECDGNTDILGGNGDTYVEMLKAWGDVTKVTGTTVWFEYHPVNNGNCDYLVDSPNIFNIWHDFSYLIEKCNVTGILYEGASVGYLFENLKAHLAAQFMWSVVENADGTVSYMSYDEFIEEIKEYLQIHYGNGWEYVYEYICMQDEAANLNVVGCQDSSANPIYDENGQHKYAVSCYISDIDLMGDMFSYEYMNENYEYMRELILKGMALVPEEDKQMQQRYEFLLMNVEMIGLSAVRKSWYLAEDATDEHKATYMERYDWLFSFLRYENLYDDGINGSEWSNLVGDEGKHIIVSPDQPCDYMEQLGDLDYYQYSPYGLIIGSYNDYNGNGKYDIGESFSVGGESWRRYTGGWEKHSVVVSWG